METVSFLSEAFTLFLHLLKEKGASGSRDGWYPSLITKSLLQMHLYKTNSKKREQQYLIHRKQMPCLAVIKINRLSLRRLREVENQKRLFYTYIFFI